MGDKKLNFGSYNERRSYNVDERDKGKVKNQR